ncbi:hypothetical protein [Aequorivita antarctica]|uniref:DUF4198 domain-containing protein n=1 Tax=Aequorivita antarctica TaxID=153266 RepID=A0A5C6Z2A4_9FLAO|nr:hypothetical protein [Aequorivita antarctica]TXD73643.1 DUF4198 domain-containing protein [Aequorivita antarctica]
MTKKLFFILFIFFGTVVKAQVPKQDVSVDTNVFPKEKVALSINSNLLLAGELLQYKTFILDASNKESKLSKVMYVSMRNENDSVVFNNKLKVENGTANGDFFIPSTLKTGAYRLIGYTNFSRNNAQDAYFQKNIYIINTFIKATDTKKTVDTVKVNFAVKIDADFSEAESNNTNTIQITSNKQSYGFREKVTLSLENNLGNIGGNYVLSVRKINPIEISGNVSRNIKNMSSEIFYIPELRGELISGVVLSNGSGLPFANKVVSLTIPGKDFVFKMAKTDANGRFFFSVSEGYDAEKSIVQLIDSEKEATNYTLVLEKKDFDLGKSEAKVLLLDSNLKDWLQERSVQVQIENAYFEFKKDSILSNKVNPAFYDNLGKVFLLDDYTRFSTVRETFVEVVTLAAVRGVGENSKFSINNAYNPNGVAKFNEIAPLVLMDGMQILNNEDLINYNAREIKSIQVITQPYRYGPKIYSGIISVETKKGDFVPTISNYTKELNLPPAVKKKAQYRTDYNNKGTLSRIPDFRSQLLWQANVPLKGEYSTSFYTSDVSGSFEITLEGYTNEGVFISAKNYFKVAEN